MGHFSRSERMLRPRLIGLMILFWLTSIVGCAATYNTITPSPAKNQASFFEDGREIVVSKKPASIVTLAPSKEAFRADERPSFIVTVNNTSNQPITFSTENLSFSMEGEQLKVFSCQELVQEIEQKKRSAATTQALIGAFGILGASMQGGKTYHSGTYQYGTTPGTYSGTSYSPLGTLQAQTTMGALTANNIANINNAASRQLNIVQNTILKKQTVLPDTWYGGYVRLANLQDVEKPASIVTTVIVGKELHYFSFTLAGDGQRLKKNSQNKGETVSANNPDHINDRTNSQKDNPQIDSNRIGTEFRICHRKAMEGEPEAQFQLGVKYERGEGVSQNYDKASKWYRKSAKQGFTPAMAALAFLYSEGKGVPKDYDHAAELYRQAGSLGNAKAQYRLGCMYYEGQGSPNQNRRLAIYEKWLKDPKFRAMSYEKKKTFLIGYFDKQMADDEFRDLLPNIQAQTKSKFIDVHLNPCHGVRDYYQAKRWFLKAAKLGLPKAQNKLGDCYFYGLGVERDYAIALKWYRRASERGCADAQFNLASMYLSGTGTPQDSVKAAKWYMRAAKQGSPLGQFNLGLMYERGMGLSQDYTEAANWYKKAAQNGYVPAQVNLAYMYDAGNGVPQDSVESAKWYRKAANQGNHHGQYNLALLYQLGQGVPQNDVKAVKWFRSAAEKGMPEAQNKLAFCYLTGRGVNKDFAEAIKWYKKASQQGYPVAQFNLGTSYLKGVAITQNLKEAAIWIRKAAEGELPTAQNTLGEMYQKGQGVKQDFAEAVKWYRKSAQKGFTDAQYNMGIMCQKGLGIERSAAKAIMWYRQAAKQGHSQAPNALGELLANSIYHEWDYIGPTTTENIFVHSKQIKRQGNLVYFWEMLISYKPSQTHFEITKVRQVGNCDKEMLGPVSYHQYDYDGNLLKSKTFKESQIRLDPVVPGSIAEKLLLYVCAVESAKSPKRMPTEKALFFGTAWPVGAGFVVTSNHVISNHSEIYLLRTNGSRIQANVALRDKSNDLALLKVKEEKLLPRALPLSINSPTTGAKVITMGFPHPDIMGTKPKLTTGIVSSIFGAGDDPRVLQISVPLQAGNSGGPLINMNGEVVGVIMSKLNAVKMFKRTGDLPQNVNYAIKLPYLKGLLSSAAVTHKLKEVKIPRSASLEEIASQITDSIMLVVAK